MKRRGFTLIELTVVITVLALIAGMVVPNLPNLQRSQEERNFRYALQRLAALGREEAIERRESVSLRIDEGADEIVLVVETAEEGEETIRSLAAPDGVRIDRTETAEGSTSPSDWQVTFEPDGRASAGGIELTANQDIFHLLVRSDGRTSVDWGELPETADDQWEAGELEQRL